MTLWFNTANVNTRQSRVNEHNRPGSNFAAIYGALPHAERGIKESQTFDADAGRVTEGQP